MYVYLQQDINLSLIRINSYILLFKCILKGKNLTCNYAYKELAINNNFKKPTLQLGASAALCFPFFLVHYLVLTLYSALAFICSLLNLIELLKKL